MDPNWTFVQTKMKLVLEEEGEVWVSSQLALLLKEVDNLDDNNFWKEIAFEIKVPLHDFL